MPELNNDMISALITASASLFTGLLGLFLGQYKSTSQRTTNLHKAQLEKVYEPLMAILLKSDVQELSEHQVKEVSDLVLKNNSIVAPALIDELLSQVKSSQQDFSMFFEILSANYNWVRKCLGYPCLEEQIRLEHIPSASKKKIHYLVFALISTAVGFVSLICMQKMEPKGVKFLLMIPYVVAYAVCCWAFSAFLKESGKI